MNKYETAEMLRELKKGSAQTTLDGKPAVIIDDCQLESFIWVINQAIYFLENDRPDYKDI